MTNDTMKMQTADPARMRCRDCIYRDQETSVLDGKKVQIGIMRATCLIFDGKKGRWKPNDVYFQNEDCLFYEQDPDANRFWEKGRK